ncbi:MAG: SMP-30/gluconolactonase/LRE family protein [Methyloligellaceae bacterium]
MTEQEYTPLLTADALKPLGKNLHRPESVQLLANGSIAVSHRGRGITLLTTDGNQHTIGPENAMANGHELIPNGIASLADGGFLLANIGEGGGVWQLSAKGELTPYLMEAEGRSLAAANFVMQTPDGRIWITVSTMSHPRFNAYTERVRDGMIVLVEDGNARILADDICFANECRVSPDGNSLYIAETFSRSISRFNLAADGSLSDRETFAQFGYGDFPDGLRFDSEGYLWLTSIVSNRIWRIAPDGTRNLILEDAEPEHMAWVEEAKLEGRMGREHFYQVGDTKLGNAASIAFSHDENHAWLGSLCGECLWQFPVKEIIGGNK